MAVSREARAMGVRKGDGIEERTERIGVLQRQTRRSSVFRTQNDVPILKFYQWIQIIIENVRIFWNVRWRILLFGKTLRVRPVVERVSCDDFFVDITDAVIASSKISPVVADVSSSESESDEEEFLQKRSVPPRLPCPTYLDVSSIYSSKNSNRADRLHPCREDPSEYVACRIVHEMRIFVKRKPNESLCGYCSKQTSWLD